MCKSSISNGICYNQKCKFVHVKGTQRNRNISDTQRKKYDQNQFLIENSTDPYVPSKRDNPSDLHFLELMTNFKKEILEEMDMKLSKIMINTQNQPMTMNQMNMRPYSNNQIHQQQQMRRVNFQLQQHNQTPQTQWMSQTIFPQHSQN